ncbi:MAG: adenine-specific DNA-methyltransferase [Arcticibacterium sp.]
MEYKTTGTGIYDLYVPFVEKGVRLLNELGRMCFIMPHKFINSNYGKSLRGFLCKDQLIEKIVHFGAQQIFEDATTYTGLFFISKNENQNVEYVFLDGIESFKNGELLNFRKSSFDTLSSDNWMFLDINESIILDKLRM